MTEIVIEHMPIQKKKRIEIRGNMLTLMLYILGWYSDNYNLIMSDFVIRKVGESEDIIKCIPIYNRFYTKPSKTEFGGRAIVMMPDKHLYILYKKFLGNEYGDWDTTKRRIHLSEAIVKGELNLEKMIGQLKDNIKDKNLTFPLYFEALDIVMKSLAKELEYESLITLSADTIDTKYDEVVM